MTSDVHQRHVERIARRKEVYDEYMGAKALGVRLTMATIAKRLGVTASRVSAMIAREGNRRRSKREKRSPSLMRDHDLYGQWQHWTPESQYREFELLANNLIVSNTDEASIGFVYPEGPSEAWRYKWRMMNKKLSIAMEAMEKHGPNYPWSEALKNYYWQR